MRGAVNVHQHGKTAIHALKRIPAAWKIEVRYTTGDTNRISLYHNLITVLYAYISPDIPPIIFESYHETDFLAG
jgi:hypothetical protein